MKLVRLLLSLTFTISAVVCAHAQAPPNDDFADRTDLGSTVPIDVTVDTREATIEDEGEPPRFDPSEPGSVWWEWEAPEAGHYLFRSSEPNGEEETRLALYSGDHITQLQDIGFSEFSYDFPLTTTILYFFERGQKVSIQASGVAVAPEFLRLEILPITLPEITAITLASDVPDTSSGEADNAVVDISVSTPEGISSVSVGLFDTRSRNAANAYFDTDPFVGSSGLVRISGDAFEAVYRATLVVPPFRAGGDWSLRLRVSDERGITTNYGRSGFFALTVEQPLPENVDGSLPVINTGEVDSALPMVGSVTYAPATADVSIESVAVKISVGAIDDTGVTSVTGRFYNADGSSYRSMGSFSPSPVSGDNRGGIYESTTTIPARVEGREVFPRITLRDSVGNSVTYGTASDPFPGGASPGLQIINSGVEDQPPVLTSVTVTPATVDISAGDQEVTVRLEATDDFSEVELASFSAGVPGGFFGGVLGSSSLISPGVFEKTFTVKQFSNPGDYSVSVTVRDETNRSARYGGTDLPLPDGSTSIVSVVNTGDVDIESPQINRLKLLPTSVDVTDSEQEVVIEIDATDDVGVKSVGVVVYDPTSEFDPFLFDIPMTQISGDALSGSYEGRFTVPAQTSAGQWILEAFISDEFGRSSSYGGLQASSLPDGFENRLTIVNDGPANQPPVLTSLTLTPLNVDITGSSQTVEIRIEAADDFSEIDYVGINIDLPQGDLSATFFADADPFPFAGQLVETSAGVFEGSILVPQFIEPGDFPIRVELSTADISSPDYLNPATYSSYSSSGGTPFPDGSPSVLSIVNTGEIDLAAPILNGITISPSVIDVTGGEQEVTVRVEAGDDVRLTGLSFFTNSESGASPLGSTSLIQNLVSGDPKSGVYEGTVTVPGHIAPETFLVGISLRDVLGRSVRYGGANPENPLPQGSDTQLVVENTGAVDQPPQLVSLNITPSIVDVSSGAQEVTISGSATDDFFPITDSFCILRSEGRTFTVLLEVDEESPGDFSGSVMIPAFIQPANYALTLTVNTGSGNSSATYREDGSLSFPDGLPTSVTVVNTGQIDQDRPQLTQFSLSQTEVDVGAGEQELTYRLEVSDDIEIGRVGVNLFEPGVSFPENRANSPVRVSGDQSSGIYEGTITVVGYAAPSLLYLEVSVTDVSGNSSFYGSSRNAFPDPTQSVLRVINTGVINLDPTLVSIEVIPSTFDVSTEPQSALVTIVASDDFSEITDINFRARSGDLGIRLGTTAFTETTPGRYEAELVIPQYTVPGDYEIDVTLSDAKGGRSLTGGGFGNSDEPLPDGSTRTLGVVNSGTVDSTPPGLYALAFSPNPVSRDRFPSTVIATIGISDALSGFSTGFLALYRGVDDFGFAPGLANFGMSELAAGDASFGVYEVEIDLGELPSTERLFTSLSLRDRVDQRGLYRDTTQQGIDLPAEFEPLMIVDSYNDAYDAWVEAHTDIPTNLTSPAADSDGDGFTNGIEFFLGMEPMLDSNATPQVPEIVMENGQFGLRVPVAEENLQMAGRTVNATPKAQWSRDGQSWRDIPAPEIVDGTMTFLTPVDAGGVKMMRFVVEFAPPLEMN